MGGYARILQIALLSTPIRSTSHQKGKNVISKTRAELEANPLHCDNCGRRIGASGIHAMVGQPMENLTTGPIQYGQCRGAAVLCRSCMFRHETTQPLHRKYYPECPVNWHDLWDHKSLRCRRGVAALLLGDGALVHLQPPTTVEQLFTDVFGSLPGEQS